MLDLPWMFSSGEGTATGDEDLHPIALVQCRFSEGILQPPSQDKKLRAHWLPCPTPRGASWIIPLGVGQNPTRACHGLLNGPSHGAFRSSGVVAGLLTPSSITEATEAAEAAKASEAGDWVVYIREVGMSQPVQGALSAPEGLLPRCRWMIHESPQPQMGWRGLSSGPNCLP